MGYLKSHPASKQEAQPLTVEQSAKHLVTKQEAQPFTIEQYRWYAAVSIRVRFCIFLLKHEG